MSVIHAPRKPELGTRQITLLAVIGGSFLALLLRLWYIQVVDGDSYQVMAEKFRWSTVETLAPRGLIFDRQNRLIAGVKPEYVVTAIPNIVQKQEWVLDRVAQMLGADKKKLKDRVGASAHKPFLPTPIYIGVPADLATRIAESAEYLPGIGVDSQPIRHYPNSLDFSHILGYVWTPDANDLERFERHQWGNPQYVGKQGIEWSLEELLKGEPGNETIEIDSRRRPIRLIGRENPEPGKRVVLTLDRDLQKYANQVLASIKDEFPESGAALAAIEPSTGEVLALSSYPTFDTSLFRGGISKAEYLALENDPLKPMFNRAVAGSYSPGSTFKVVTALAALQTGHFSVHRPVVCRGYIEVGREKKKCLGVHGSISFRNAFAKSCNAYFGDLSVKAQRKGLNEAAISLGLGYPTEIELRGESGGSLPTDKWLRKLEERTGVKPRWYLGNTVNVGIGQGEVNTTVLQMANVAAAVANGGVNYKPHLLKAVIDDTGTHATKPQIAHEVSRGDGFWYEVQQAMIGVIEYGTAQGAATIPGVRWAGKTGSTESRGNRLTHSWFIGYAPAENPRIAIAVVVEKAGHGAQVAAPLAKLVVQRFLVPPSSTAPVSEPQQ